jgi:hypothetical protein
MTPAERITRIKAYATVYKVDTTAVDELTLLRIARAANSNEWNIVDDIMKELGDK